MIWFKIPPLQPSHKNSLTAQIDSKYANYTFFKGSTPVLHKKMSYHHCYPNTRTEMGNWKEATLATGVTNILHE